MYKMRMRQHMQLRGPGKGMHVFFVIMGAKKLLTLVFVKHMRARNRGT